MPEKEADISKWLKEGRQMLGLTQKEMADKLGISIPTYSKWELGHRKPKYDKLIAIGKEISTLGTLDKNIDISYINYVYIYNILEDIYNILVKKSKKGSKKVQNGYLTTELVNCFIALHQHYRGFAPPQNPAAYGSVIKRLRSSYDEESIKKTMIAFFKTPGRTKTSIYNFESSFINVYGYLYDKATGKRK